MELFDNSTYMNDIYLNKLTKYIPFLSFKLNDSRTVGACYSAGYRVNNMCRFLLPIGPR